MKKLDALDAYAHSKLGKIALDHRKVLTSHDAFGYFGRKYDVQFLAPIGVSTESKPRPPGSPELIEQIKAEHVKTYFFENSNDPRLVRQIAKATRRRAAVASSMSNLFPTPKDPASTYEKMFR